MTPAALDNITTALIYVGLIVLLGLYWSNGGDTGGDGLV
jgi:hypothetical protein